MAPCRALILFLPEAPHLHLVSATAPAQVGFTGECKGRGQTTLRATLPRNLFPV